MARKWDYAMLEEEIKPLMDTDAEQLAIDIDNYIKQAELEKEDSIAINLPLVSMCISTLLGILSSVLVNNESSLITFLVGYLL